MTLKLGDIAPLNITCISPLFLALFKGGFHRMSARITKWIYLTMFRSDQQTRIVVWSVRKVWLQMKFVGASFPHLILNSFSWPENSIFTAFWNFYETLNMKKSLKLKSMIFEKSSPKYLFTSIFLVPRDLSLPPSRKGPDLGRLHDCTR